MSRSMKVLFFIFSFFVTLSSFANNPGVSYQGRIFKPDGNPLEGTTVQFRMQVRSPGSENCLLYEEVQTLNMAGSSGVFALTLNDGTGTRLDAATYQVDRIFANRETMTLDTTRCATGTTYTPNSSDGRKLVVYFKDETMAAYEAMPLMNLNYVPQAMYALEAQKVDKFEVSNILRAVDGSGNPATAPALNPTQLLNLTTLLATPAANYVQTTTNGSAALPVVAGNPSSGLAAGQIWYDSGSNVMKYYDGAVKTFGTSGGGVTSVATGTGLTGGPITSTGTINVDVGVTTGKIVQVAASNKLPVIDGSNLTNITATDATKLPLAGGTMTGPLVNNSSSASTALAVTQAGAGYAATFMGGNVGIGTTSPTSALHVLGADGVFGSVNAPSVLNVVGGTGYSTGGTGASVSISAGSGTVNSAGGDLTLTGGAGSGVPNYSARGNVLIKAADVNGVGGGVVTLKGGGWNSSNGSSISVTSTSSMTTGAISLSTLNAGGTPGNSGGISITTGNSAFGSTAGAINMSTGAGSVNGVGGTMNISTGAGSGTGSGGPLNVTAGAGGATSGTGANVVINGGAKGGTGIDGNVILANARGNVGIGTTTPNALLDVNGTMRVSQICDSAGANCKTVSGGWSAAAVLSALTAATGPGTIDNTNFAQTWNWSTATTQTPMAMTADALTTGTLLNLTSSSASLNSTNGLLNIANTSASTTGTVARIQSNSTAGSGLTVLANGNVGIGTASPNNPLVVALPAVGANSYLTLSSATASTFNTYFGTTAYNQYAWFTNVTYNGSAFVRDDNTKSAWRMSQVVENTDQFSLTHWDTGGTLTYPFTILGTGNVGIGTTSPQTTLQVAGIISPATNNTYSLGNATYRFTEVYATNGTINTSDRREKKDIYDTDLGLDFINKLRPVSYRWNTGVDDDVHYGLIAQEAEQVIAETGKSEKTSIVTHDETTDRYGVRYSELISPLIKAVQELYNRFLGVDREIASVKAENATIKQENAEVKARLDQQEKELAAIKNKLGL